MLDPYDQNFGKMAYFENICLLLNATIFLTKGSPQDVITMGSQHNEDILKTSLSPNTYHVTEKLGLCMKTLCILAVARFSPFFPS